MTDADITVTIPELTGTSAAVVLTMQDRGRLVKL
jgi:hypothetical protein